MAEYRGTIEGDTSTFIYNDLPYYREVVNKNGKRCISWEMINQKVLYDIFHIKGIREGECFEKNVILVR